MSRKLVVAPSPLVGHIFRNESGEKMLINNDTFAPSDVDVDSLDAVSFDVVIQSAADNVLAKLTAAKEEIQTAIENFE